MGKLISVKCDGVSIRCESFMGINCQIFNDSKINVLFLGVRRLMLGSNSEQSLKILLDVLGTYGIGVENLISLTCDNGANYIKLGNYLENEQIVK